MVSCKKILIALTFVITLISRSECGVLSLIRDLLQWNLVGTPDYHRNTEWDFDPDVASKNREQFYESHGFRSSRLLERIGEGFDGRHRERHYQHAIRDDGRLQGLNLLAP